MNKFRAPCAPILRYLAATLVVLNLISPLAVAGQKWPLSLDSFSKATGNCDGNRVPKQKGTSPVIKAYTAFTAEQICRLTKFKKAFEEDPTEFCPEMVPATFNTCYEKILESFVAKPGLDTTGFMVMQSIAIAYILKHKSEYGDQAEMALELIKAGAKSLKFLPERVKPEKLAEGHITAQDRNEIAALQIIDQDVSSKYVQSLLKSIMKQLERVQKLFERWGGAAQATESDKN